MFLRSDVNQKQKWPLTAGCKSAIKGHFASILVSNIFCDPLFPSLPSAWWYAMPRHFKMHLSQWFHVHLGRKRRNSDFLRRILKFYGFKRRDRSWINLPYLSSHTGACSFARLIRPLSIHVFVKVCTYFFIGLYLLCVFIIAYLFRFYNWQIIRM